MKTKHYLTPATDSWAIKLEKYFCQSGTTVTTEEIGDMTDLFGDDDNNN